MARLVEALNACWRPHALPGRPPAPPDTLAGFRRDIRERQIWCSSCLLATEGAATIGVLVGAKRATGTLIDRIAVRPGFERRGHGRHMVESLSAKLAILGPPRLIAEVPDADRRAAAFFEACGFAREGALEDWVLDDLPAAPRPGDAPPGGDTFLVPVPPADLAANRLLQDPPGVAWDRAAETLLARGDGLRGIAAATLDGFVAFALWRPDPDGGPGAEVAALRTAPGTPAPAARAALGLVVGRLAAEPGLPLRQPRVAPAEIPEDWLASLGFRRANAWSRFAMTASAA